MVTSLQTEGGRQGGRVVGATGFNNRTGEFMVFKSRAAVLSMARGSFIWMLNTELAGYSTMQSRALSGDGTAMAWKAGAALTMMEASQVTRIAGGYKHKWYTGAGDASYENVKLIDDNGKPLPVIGEPGWNMTRKNRDRSGVMDQWDPVHEDLLKGEYALPFYGDFPSMAGIERESTWHMLLKQESTTKIIVDTFDEAGFDPSRDVLMNYHFLEGASLPQWREVRGGGLVIDWNLKTTLDGLYAAGGQIFATRDHSFAAATGRYAGRKAADYARQAAPAAISREQVALEKKRVYAPVQLDKGLDWKELHAGVARAMQFFCSEYKTEKLLNMGLNTLKEIEEKWVPQLFALDPHKLMRGQEDLSMLSYAQLILHASLARRASSRPLTFNRIDYPQLDPPEWNKFITVNMDGGKVKIGELPFAYYGNMKKNYEAYNKDYAGVYQGK
jgi:succinate dehydrogenase/fumarate reductase flavoprotein subunit